MTRTTRIFPVLFSTSLSRTHEFYVRFLGMAVDFESEWFVSLESPDDHTKELGIRSVDDDLVPEQRRSRLAGGGMVVFVVDDADAVHRAMTEAGVEVLTDPIDQPHGQRQFLAVDPDGVILDISSPIPMSSGFVESLVETGSTTRQIS